MVGVCLTVIGIIHIIIKVRGADTLVDDFLCADAILFLISCCLSYWALRARPFRRMRRIEKFADFVFLAGLFFMVIICGLMTYAVAFS
jgi:drug/metabolite transporter (DMT)-like permease